MIRIFIFSLVGFLLMTILGPLQTLLGFHLVVLDIPLLIVLYMSIGSRGSGFIRPSSRFTLFPGGIDWSGGITGLFLGYMCDVMGGGAKGIHSLIMVVIFLVSLWAARHVYLGGTLSVSIIVFLASLIATSMGVLGRWIMGVQPSPATITFILVQSLLCAAVAPVLMILLRYIDGKLSSRSSERGSLCQ
jgi:cell shape-determining protein MreD